MFSNDTIRALADEPKFYQSDWTLRAFVPNYEDLAVTMCLILRPESGLTIIHQDGVSILNWNTVVEWYLSKPKHKNDAKILTVKGLMATLDVEQNHKNENKRHGFVFYDDVEIFDKEGRAVSIEQFLQALHDSTASYVKRQQDLLNEKFVSLKEYALEDKIWQDQLFMNR